MSQWLSEVEAHGSKIAEFGLTLNERTARWHSQLDITTFASFDQLRYAFLRFFHRSISQCEIIGQFYSIWQLQQESVTDFSLRFENLRCQLTRAPTKDEVKETFLVALRQPLRIML